MSEDAGLYDSDHRHHQDRDREHGLGRPGRRGVLAALGGCACAPSAGWAAPARASGPWRIDVHHHFGSPAYDRFLAAHPDAGLPPAPPNSIARSIVDMDAGGTELAVLSSFVPATGGDEADRRALARGINEYGAGAVRDHAGRFALFAVLPLPDVEGCLVEVAYGLDTLGAVGVTVYSEAMGKYLGDPQFEPLMQELDRRGALLFVHPHTDACCRNLVKGVPDSVIEYGVSTTRTLASLVFSGVATRYPNIRFLFSHGGGTMPFLIERFLGTTSAEIVPGVRTFGQSSYVAMNQPPGTALAALRRFHYDTAQIANPAALRVLATVVGSSQIVYGTDFWFRGTGETARGLDTSGAFTSPELRAIGRANALTLIPALRSRIAHA